MIFLFDPLLFIWIVIGVCLVAWCGMFCHGRTKSLAQGLVASGLVFLVYFGNEFYAYSKWKLLCSLGTDLKVYHVQEVKGFGMKYAYSEYARWYLAHGYEFIDAVDARYPGERMYLYKMSNGQVQSYPIKKRLSEYFFYAEVDSTKLVHERTSKVIRSSDGLKMGEFSEYGYSFGYAIQILKTLVGYDRVQGQASWCESKKTRRDLISAVIPAVAKQGD